MAGHCLSGHEQRNGQVASKATVRKDRLSWNPHPPSTLNRLLPTPLKRRHLDSVRTAEVALHAADEDSAILPSNRPGVGRQAVVGPINRPEDLVSPLFSLSPLARRPAVIVEICAEAIQGEAAVAAPVHERGI
jgi:hypothetical protein